MFEIKNHVENVMDNMEEIARNYYDLTVVNAVSKGSKLGSAFVINAIICALGFFVFLFAGFGAGYWIGQQLESPVLGFFIVAGFLLLVLIIILVLKGKVIQPWIRNIIIKNIYDID